MQPGGGLPQPLRDLPGRLGATSRGVHRDHSLLGNARNRPILYPKKMPVKVFYLLKPQDWALGDRRTSEFQNMLRLPSSTSDSLSPKEIPIGTDKTNTNRTILAPGSLIYSVSQQSGPGHFLSGTT